LPGDPAGRRERSKHPLRELIYRLRTEGDSPRRLAAAVGLGVLIGCSPFYGFHLLLCILVARLFRLNRALTYLAAHVSLPFLWPLLVLAEVQVGRRLRGGELLAIHPAQLKQLDPWQFGVDLLVGSALVGAVLAAALSLLTWWMASRRRALPAIERLIEETSLPYLESGLSHWEYVRGKLRHDPVYFHLLRAGVLPASGRLLDLGCGRGILPALLASAQSQFAAGTYPAEWPPPPALEVHGVEARPQAAAAARQALAAHAGAATIETADLQHVALPDAAAVVLLDVLHYLPAGDQEELLARAAAALAPGGCLVLREADAAGGVRFSLTRAQERLAALARGHLRQRFHYRTEREWRRLLQRLGLTAEARPMARGTPYANFLITARKGL
jgi:uncharacterized protein (DUF2062 family)/trans-aconitate methyltransferase